MHRLVCAAATAALALHVVPAAAEEAFTPPPGHVVVPAPPPGYTLEAVPVERSWAVGASVGRMIPDPPRGAGDRTHIGAYADVFVTPRLSLGLFADRLSAADGDGDITSVGASVTRRFFGGARSTHLRGGLGVSHQHASYGEDAACLRTFLGFVVRIGDRAALFLQGTLDKAYAFGRVHSLSAGSLALGLEFGN